MGTTGETKIKDDSMIGMTDETKVKGEDHDHDHEDDDHDHDHEEVKGEKIKDDSMMGTTGETKIKDDSMMGMTDAQQGEKVKDGEVVATMADGKEQPQDSNQQQATTQDQQQTTNTKVKSQKATYTPATAIVEMGQVAGAATFPTVFLYLLYKRFTEDKVKALPILYTKDAGGKDKDEEQ